MTLDVAAPEDVAKSLRAAAERYRESAVELSSAWQDQNAGKVWNRIATILEAAAKKVDSVA